jgi:hypothetical protein
VDGERRRDAGQLSLLLGKAQPAQDVHRHHGNARRRPSTRQQVLRQRGSFRHPRVQQVGEQPLQFRLARAEPKTLRYRLWSAPARLITHAGQRILKIPPTWPWAEGLARAFTRVHALHPA